jgi:adenylate cyclase
MATGDVKRKLTAIFSADVEGYSRLMEEDELSTVETLTSHKEIMRKLIRKYRGRVVDSTGDNLLAEFGSVVDAVQCAVEVQQVLSAKNEALPENRRMYFRIGINSGDVIEEGDLIYGDGVNVAARVESLAEGGGISISGTAYDQLGKKLPLGYEYLGEQTVKNIEKPVRVYRILTEAEAAGKVIGEVRPKTKQLRWAAVGALAVLIIGAGALAIWNFYFRPAFEPASIEKMAFPLPDKPSIAVLPFDNLSGDPEQDYIADVITDNIISALSYIPEMFVIARNSSFTYKGKPVKVQQVSEELGVRYLLEGSVLKSGEKVRITAQLIDALTGGHIWSKRFDRDLTDLFNLLDEITKAITVALQVKLTHGEQARMWYRSTRDLEAWGYVVRGLSIFYYYTKEAMAKSRELFEQALEIDPENAHALTMLAWTHFIDTRFGHADSRDESLKRAVELAKKALSMDDNQSLVHSLWQHIYLVQRQHDKAVEEGRKAIALGPNDAEVHILFGEALFYSGMSEESVQMCEKAMRLHPHTPLYYFGTTMNAYYGARRYDESLAMAEQLIERSRKVKYERGVSWGQWGSALALMELGRESQGRRIVDQAVREWPQSSNLDYVRKYSSWAFYKDPDNLQHILDTLRKAGLPETPPLPLPDKPSIAVLPFVNMSGDPEQEYIGDGISEEIINALSKISKLFVIARESSFSYKGKQVNVPQIARPRTWCEIYTGGKCPQI